MADEATPFEIYPGQIEADPEIALLLGVFVARWSLAEFSLMLAFLVALGSRRQEVATTVLASATSAEAKIQIVLKTLNVAEISEERRDAIRRAVKALDKLCPERNALMHHLWGRRSTGEIITINFREADSAKTQIVRTPASIKELCNAVVDAAYGISVSTGSTWIDAAAAKQLGFRRAHAGRATPAGLRGARHVPGTPQSVQSSTTQRYARRARSRQLS